MARQDWLLMALASRAGAPMDPVQVQKAMFLLGREIPDKVESGFYHFEPYNYGPFDSNVYTDLERLANRGLVSISRDTRGTRAFAVTPEGLRQGAELLRSADVTARSYLDRVVQWVCSLTFADLVRAIYARYPEFKRNSVFAS